MCECVSDAVLFLPFVGLPRCRPVTLLPEPSPDKTLAFECRLISLLTQMIAGFDDIPIRLSLVPKWGFIQGQAPVPIRFFSGVTKYPFCFL